MLCKDYGFLTLSTLTVSTFFKHVGAPLLLVLCDHVSVCMCVCIVPLSKSSVSVSQVLLKSMAQQVPAVSMGFTPVKVSSSSLVI